MSQEIESSVEIERLDTARTVISEGLVVSFSDTAYRTLHCLDVLTRVQRPAVEAFGTSVDLTAYDLAVSIVRERLSRAGFDDESRSSMRLQALVLLSDPFSQGEVTSFLKAKERSI